LVAFLALFALRLAERALLARTAMKHITVLLAAVLTACAPIEAPDKGPAEEAPIDGAYDSFRSPVEHRELLFGRAELAELTVRESFHAWTFTLREQSSVALRTERAMPGLPEVDTMIYVYRESERGWGRVIASNDDAPGTLFSALSRSLAPGRYRVLVKGYARASVGPFALVAECAGPGCGPDVDGCLFGDTYGDLASSARVAVSVRDRWTSADGLSDLQRAQVVRAVQQSSHTDVTTAEEAFARVDQQEVNRLELYDAEGARAFTAMEYGAGDNSYGAIFAQGTTTLVTHIHDGDLLDCTVSFETCVFGSTFRAFAEADSLDVVSDAEIRDAHTLSPARASQLTRAVRETYDEVTTAAEAIARVDGDVVNERVRRDRATGRTFVAYEYGAGDNSYGLVFEGDSLDVAARIGDGDLYACTATRPPR
jgi:hypothetical protein